MLPVKDNVPTDRLPVVTLLLLAANVAGWLVLRDGGLLRLLANALALAIFAPTVEDAMSRARFAAFALLGAGAASGLQAALDPGSALLPAAAGGAVAAGLGAHPVLYLRARGVSIVLVPFAFTLVEVPAGIFLALWLALQAALGDWALFAAQAGALLLGALLIRAFAQRRRPFPPPSSSAIAAGARS